MFNFDPYQQPDNSFNNIMMSYLMGQLLSRRFQGEEPEPGQENPYDYGGLESEEREKLPFIFGKHSNEMQNLPFIPGLHSNKEQKLPYDLREPQGKSDLSSLMESLRNRESSGRYGITNPLGFAGAYQFGAPALETVGLLKQGAGKLGNKALLNPENWKIPGGEQAFLQNPGLQDEAMRRLMEANRKRLSKMGLITPHTDPLTQNAMLAAAHIAGPGGVRGLLKGRNPKDAFGTPASAYFKLGYNA